LLSENQIILGDISDFFSYTIKIASFFILHFKTHRWQQEAEN